MRMPLGASMLLFQTYAQRPREGEGEEEGSRIGMKVRRRVRRSLLGTDEEIEAALSKIEKSFREEGISGFISTLTPGTQNAIYAASFVWGYENAAKYVKNAMKVEEVKNAADAVGKSRAVVESIQSQASGPAEKNRETSSFVWSFYNEDLKETQAQAGVTENLSQKEKAKAEEELEKVRVPLSAQEAAAMAVLS